MPLEATVIGAIEDLLKELESVRMLDWRMPGGASASTQLDRLERGHASSREGPAPGGQRPATRLRRVGEVADRLDTGSGPSARKRSGATGVCRAAAKEVSRSGRGPVPTSRTSGGCMFSAA